MSTDASLDHEQAFLDGQCFVKLPNSVLTTILERTAKLANPGQLLKLAITCRSLFQAITEAEGLWEALSISHGWSGPRSGARPALPPTGDAAALTCTSVLRELDRRWFMYYSRRMTSRRNLRRFMRLYTSFLSRPSSMALLPGAEPAALEASERRLGVALPWDLWELYRFRNGQAAGGPLVVFADDMRLLPLEEVVMEHHPALPDLRKRLAMMGQTPLATLPRPSQQLDAQLAGAVFWSGIMDPGLASASSTEGSRDPQPAGSCVPIGSAATGGAAVVRPGSNSGAAYERLPGAHEGLSHAALPAAEANSCEVERPGAASSAVTTSVETDDDLDDRVLVIAANSSCSRRLMVAINGQVFLARGLSVAFFASGVAAMVQKLLA